MAFQIYTKSKLDQLIGTPTSAGRALLNAASVEAQQALLGVNEMVSNAEMNSAITTKVFDILQAGANVTLDKQLANSRIIIAASGGGGDGGGATSLEELSDVSVLGQSSGSALVSDGLGNWSPSTAASILEGDSRLTNSRNPTPHQHVKADITDLGESVPPTRTVNSKALSADINLTAADVGAVPPTRTVNGKALSADISLTATDVGAVPPTRTVNGKALSADISLTAADVGAATAAQGNKADSAVQSQELSAAIQGVRNMPYGERWMTNTASLTKDTEVTVPFNAQTLGNGMATMGYALQVPENGVYWYCMRSAIYGANSGPYQVYLRRTRSAVTTVFAVGNGAYGGNNDTESLSTTGLVVLQASDTVSVTVRISANSDQLIGTQWSPGEGNWLTLLKVAD